MLQKYLAHFPLFLAVTSVILAEDILVTGTAQEGIRVWHPATLTLLASGRLDNEMKVHYGPKWKKNTGKIGNGRASAPVLASGFLVDLI